MAKYYVHTIEGVSLAEFSWVAKNVGANSTVADVIESFVTAYNKKNPEQAIEDVSSVELFYDEEKKKRLVKVDEPIGKLLKQFSDIFVAPKQTATSANKPTEPKGEDIAEEVKKEENKEPEKPKIPVEEAIALDKAKAATLKDEGNKCMNEKKYQEAVEKYSVAIELDPTNAVLYSNRAQAHLSIDKHHEALVDADKALLIDNQNPKAYFRKGMALLKLGRAEDAKVAFQTGLSVPNLDDANKNALQTWKKKAEVQIAEDAKAIKEGSKKIEVKAPKVASTANAAPTSPEAKAFLTEAHKLAKNAEDKKNFRGAASVYEEALKVSEYDPIALLHLGNIYFGAKKFQKAAEYFYKGSFYHVLNLEFAVKLGDSYLNLKDYKNSAEAYTAALKRCTSETERKTVKVKIGQLLYEAGDHANAVEYWKDVLKTDEDFFDALLAYGQALIDHGTVPDDSLPVYLKLLVKDTENEKVRQKLSELVMHERGYEVLQESLKVVPSSASAFAFLANVLKDNGALEVAEKLYLEALAIDPQNASLALNYVHILEMRNLYEAAFQFIKSFTKSNKDLNVGQLTCGHIYNVLKRMDTLSDVATNEPAAVATTSPAALALDKMYGPSQLDLLAFFCTTVKTIYLSGLLDLIKPLSDIINPVREGREMHTTTIRNEHAYFSCIDQLMTYQPTKIHMKLGDLPPLYWSGDSHALVTAYQKINFKGTPHRIVPKLVTGLKCWHLRDESTFYPKFNFYNVVRTIPEGANVVFQFGEIDCREGIVFAVQKMIYENIAEGARVAVDIYLKVLLKLKEEYGWTIFVHPPAPVIDVTREIVKIFNSVLKQRVQETPDKEKLASAYELDGTHMNPTYLPLVEQALATVAPS